MLISDIGIANKLSLGFGIVLLMLGGVMLFNNMTINVSQNGFISLFDNEIAIDDQADNVHISLLKLRSLEKDFLLNSNLSYAQQHQNEWKALQKKVGELHNIASLEEHQNIVQHAKKLSTYADNYRDNFGRLVNVKQKMGLDENSGLQGEFRLAAHALSKALAGHNVVDLYQQYLLLRRWEKDFVRTKKEKYKQRLLSTLKSYVIMLKQSSCEENAKQIQQAALSGYTQTLDLYFNHQGSDNNRNNYEQMRKFAHQMEDALIGVFIQDGQTLALQIRRNEKDYLLRGGDKYSKKTNDSIETLKTQVAKSKMLSKHATQLTTLLNIYENAFNKLVVENDLAQNYTKTLHDAAHKMHPVIKVIKSLIEKSRTEAISKSLLNINLRQTVSFAIAILIFIVGLLAAIVITRSISKPINEMMKVVRSIAKGDLSQHLNSNRGDEIGELATSINTMVATLNQIADQADAIAGGDFTTDVAAKSDTDRLAISLNDMKNQITKRTLLMKKSESELQRINTKLLQQNELKSVLSKMTESDHGSDNLQAICDKSISALSKMMQAGHGALYLTGDNKGDNEKNCLTLVGSYALKRGQEAVVIPMGAGLVGQCAIDQTCIIITQVPEDYIFINSALGEQLPLNIMLSPVRFEDKLIAVIEIASFNTFTQEQQESLQQITEYIGFIINQQKNKRLLKQLQGHKKE